MNYYEQTRDAIERLAQCTTSDAQSIIEAWELSNGGTMMEQVNMNKAEEAGAQPEDLARTILGTNKATPIMEEFLILVNGASAFLDMEADEQTPDPIEYGTDLARDAFNRIETVQEHYARLVASLEAMIEAYDADNDASDGQKHRAMEEARTALASTK